MNQAAMPPFLSFITFNRLGLNVKNLNRLLSGPEDFEMHIIDSGSKDDTWEFIMTLKDERIKSKTRFPVNRGPIYAVNFNLARRKPDQYFITADSDVYIKTGNWISRFMEVFEAFPEVGLLGVMRDNPYPRYMPPVTPRCKDGTSYLELKNAQVGVSMDFIPGCLQFLRPGLINEIGYWSEENGYGDAELSPRVVHYTPFKAGFVTSVEIDMSQTISCDECEGTEWCKLSRSVNHCCSLSRKSNVNDPFVKKSKQKYLDTFIELENGNRTAYCASVHDPDSRKNHVYNEKWANENFNHYEKNTN